MKNNYLYKLRLKIEDTYIKKFADKHDYGEYYISGDLICFHDGYYTFHLDTIYYDIDNNCGAGEPFKWIDWLAENPEINMNYQTWIGFGGSEKSEAMKILMDKSRINRIEKIKKDIEYLKKILEEEIKNEN